MPTPRASARPLLPSTLTSAEVRFKHEFTVRLPHHAAPVTPRKGWRVARVRQDGVDFAEIRACSFDPKWEPSAGDHRSAIRAPALRRVIAALQALEAKIGDGA